MTELQEVPGRRLGATFVVDVDRGMGRRAVGIHEHRRDAQTIEDFERTIIGRQAQADEPVHRRLPDRAFEGAVKRRNEEQGQVVLFALLAKTLDELADKRVGEDRRKTLWDEQADRPAAPHRQGARRGMRHITEVFGDAQHAFQRGVAQPLRVVEGERNSGLGHAGRRRHVSDGDPGHPARLLP